jgi:RNase P subunit RPR2
MLMFRFENLAFSTRCMTYHLVKMVTSIKEPIKMTMCLSCHMPLVKVNILLVNMMTVLNKLKLLKNCEFL